MPCTAAEPHVSGLPIQAQAARPLGRRRPGDVTSRAPSASFRHMRRFCIPPRQAWAYLLGLLILTSPFGAVAETTAPTDLDKAAHALNRLGYGPRPGELERVASTGVEKWMRAQLAPETIPDTASEAEIAKLEKLKLPASDFVAAERAVVQARRQQQAEASAAQATAGTPAAASPAPAAPARRERDPELQEARQLVPSAIGELQYAKLLRAVHSEHQLEEVLVDFWFNHFNVDARKQAVSIAVVRYEQNTIRPHVFGTFRDLLGATAKSAAMMVYLDNARSSKEQELGPAQQRAAARLRAETTGMSMEEAMTASPNRRGLNENYGRELLELHTLGVDGGYTQKDVQEVARAFTGWTVEPGTGEFVFRRRMHDTEVKHVLGTRIPAGGSIEDGEKVLDLLATHPATARHLAFKLVQRFVNDTPPDALVRRVADTFLRTGGDLRATYEAIFFSPEFFAPENLRAKTKSPFEFLASSLRASDAEFIAPGSLLRNRVPVRAIEANAALGRGGDRFTNLPRKTNLLHLVEMGQSLYAWGPPTGFPEDSSTWVSAGALVSRLNYALALTSGQVADARIDVRPLLGTANPDKPDAVVDAISRSLLGAPPSQGTRRVLLTQAAPSVAGATAVPDVGKVLALLLGSPEFQRR